MTPDLTARIEELARECATNINGHIVDNDWVKREFIELDTLTITAALTSLANQIIAEKDAEAAGIIETIEGVWDAASDVNAHQAVAYLSDCLEKIKERRPTTGRDTLAELTRLRARVQELEGRVTITPEGE